MRRIFLPALIFLLALPALAAAASTTTGRVAEYKLGPGTHAQSLVAGPDGNIWFAGLSYGPTAVTDVVGRVTPAGNVTEFSLGSHPENLGLSDIAVGPDGNLWFTEGGRAKVGRITTAGQVTEFDLPTGGAGPSSIVAGPDGNLWFTEEALGRVGRITTSGVATEFSLLSGGTRPYGIAAGPDGALWMAEPMASTIARVDTAGLVTNFRLPDDDLYPREVIAGPDGALWFSQVGASAVGRIGTAGEIADFPVPGGDQTFALANGPSGDLWYSNGGGRIGSLTTGGATARPACAGSCRAPITSLAQGPEGRLWFAAGTLSTDSRQASGTVGTFAPVPLEAGVLPASGPRGRNVLIPVRCDWGAAGSRCEGHLRLSTRVPGGAGGPARSRLLADRRLSLPLGAERRFKLGLPGFAMRQLGEDERLVVFATTDVAGGHRDLRKIVLPRP